MIADIHVCIVTPSKSVGDTCVVANANNVTFRAPNQLMEAQFPGPDTTFPLDANSSNPSADGLYKKLLADVGAGVAADKGSARNTIVYAYGQQGCPKRQHMFGPGGYAERCVADAVARKGAGEQYVLTGYIFGLTENLVDCLNAENTQGLIVDTVKEGPKVRHIDRVTLQSAADVANAFKTISANVAAHFADVAPDHFDSIEAQALPPYNSDTTVVTLLRYQTAEDVDSGVENNSLNFVALGDSERPALCGVDPLQIQQYEKNQKTLGSVVGVMQAIRNSRLRIPYGKSKLTLLLKRAYNGDKNNANNATNLPSRTLLLAYALDDEPHAEEAFHTLTMARRVHNMLAAVIVGSVTRDMAVEKWRLEQDIMELKDELTIAKQVHEYKPYIYEQTKPIANIAEEEHKRVTAILKKREEARDKQLAEVRAKASDEAKRIIEEEERKSAMTLQQLEREVELKRAENAELQAERAAKVKEYEKHLEKIRKKKDEEEALLEKLREEIYGLEEEVKARQEGVEKKRRQLEMTSQDQAKGREAILKEREEVKTQRAKLLEERRKQREGWIAQIRETNEKVLAQVQLLTRERLARQQKEGVSAQADEDEIEETEQQVREDIQSIDQHLPKLISLEDNPVDLDVTESIRKQLEEYFTQERDTYLKKLEEEKERKAKLEKTVDMFRSRLQESQAKVLKDQMGDALRKDQHLSSLVDSVLLYLCNGIKMFKVNSQGAIRRRFFFLSECHQRIHCCELDEAGQPVNRRRPTITIYLRDVRQVILGCYTPSFVNFAGTQQLVRARGEAIRNDGTYNPEPTLTITPQNLGRYNYRAFALVFRGGKTLELVTETDSDAEAWIVALKRLFNYKTQQEIENEKKARRLQGQPYTPSEPLAQMGWGASFDVNGRDGVAMLNPREAEFCSLQHIAPSLFLRIKREVQERAQSAIITVYDIRVVYSTDLLRSQALYEYFIATGLFPAPQHQPQTQYA